MGLTQYKALNPAMQPHVETMKQVPRPACIVASSTLVLHGSDVGSLAVLADVQVFQAS